MNCTHTNPFRLRVLAAILGLCLVEANAGEAIILTTLHSFSGLEDGVNPVGLLEARDGNFYGTTSANDIATTDGPYGTVFRITPDGAFTNLHVFDGVSDGKWPQVGLAQDTDGNFYGTTYRGGTSGGWGTVFKITPSGEFTTVHSFNVPGNDASSLLVRASDGNFYTMLNQSGTFSLGTLLRVAPDGTVTELVEFDGIGGYTGWFSNNPLLQGADGNLYGATAQGGPAFVARLSFDVGYGTLFKMTLDGTLNTLVGFNGTNGAYPTALAQAPDGNLYGTASRGGPEFVNRSGGSGTVFKLTTNGVFTTLAVFDRTNGIAPNSLMLASDGNFYGTTSIGGTNAGYGTIFKMTAEGVLTSLFSFNRTNGANPSIGSLVQAADGAFYGTTYGGGASNHGTIFRFQITPDPPRLENISQNASGGLTFTWAALTGRSYYQVQFKSDLTSTNWSTLGDPVVATNTTASANDVIGPDRQRFYRILLLP